jgi:hypothetical protein
LFQSIHKRFRALNDALIRKRKVNCFVLLCWCKCFLAFCSALSLVCCWGSKILVGKAFHELKSLLACGVYPASSPRLHMTESFRMGLQTDPVKPSFCQKDMSPYAIEVFLEPTIYILKLFNCDMPERDAGRSSIWGTSFWSIAGEARTLP